MKRALLMVFLAFSVGACSWFSSKPSRVENPVVLGVNYVGMSVSDLARTASVYQQSSQMITIPTESISNTEVLQGLGVPPKAQVSSQLLRSSNSQLLLMQFDGRSEAAELADPVKVYGPGIAHICVQAAKRTQTYETFLEQGARVIGAPEMVQISSRNPVEYAYIHDQDEIIIEVEHVDVAALELDTPPKNDYRIRQVALSTHNMDRLMDFYSVLLETRDPRRIGKWINLSGEKLDKISGEVGSEIEMGWFQIRNLELEIIQYHSHPGETPDIPRPIDALGYNMITFDVTDLQQARAKLLEAGGEVVMEPVSFHGGMTLFGRDPDGNLLGFQVLNPDSPFSAKQFADNGL